MIVPQSSTLILLHSDAESRLLADAEVAIESVFGEQGVRLIRAWMPSPHALQPDAPAIPAALFDDAPAVGDVRALLEQVHGGLVVLCPFGAVSVPTLRHRDSGAVFLAHHGLAARWSREVAAGICAQCSVEPPMQPRQALAALEPLIERLQSVNAAVAVTNAFRHVPRDPERPEALPALRETVREFNVEIARLSFRTGCFVLDLDRPLAQEGGASLHADCFGGNGRGAELILDEFAATVLDAMPAQPISMGEQ